MTNTPDHQGWDSQPENQTSSFDSEMHRLIVHLQRMSMLSGRTGESELARETLGRLRQSFSTRFEEVMNFMLWKTPEGEHVSEALLALQLFSLDQTTPYEQLLHELKRIRASASRANDKSASTELSTSFPELEKKASAAIHLLLQGEIDDDKTCAAVRTLFRSLLKVVPSDSAHDELCTLLEKTLSAPEFSPEALKMLDEHLRHVPVSTGDKIYFVPKDKIALPQDVQELIASLRSVVERFIDRRSLETFREMKRVVSHTLRALWSMNENAGFMDEYAEFIDILSRTNAKTTFTDDQLEMLLDCIKRAQNRA